MPELPEVETVVGGLRPKLIGRTVRRVLYAARVMTGCAPSRFRARLESRSFVAVDRHGKWIFLSLSDSGVLVIHLGMTGRLGVVSAGEPVADHTHLRLELDAGADELRFVDARRFGRVLICDPRSMHRRFGPKQLGPDAMRVAVSDLTARLAKTRRKIKAALLEQRLIAGIGNIYADEILFAARVCPTTPAFRLDPDAVARIDRAMRTVLNRALRHGGTTIRDYVSGDGAPGNFQNYLAVYGRAKQPCKKCSTPIELTRTIVSGRATYWCPTCQAARK